MIHYQLQCAAGHNFDGWFKDSAAFDRQAQRGLLECPICGNTAVERALMTPSVPRKTNARPDPASPAQEPVAREPAAQERGAETPAAEAAPTPPQPANSSALAGHIPDHVRAMLQRLRTEVEKNCDYVGEQFAEEARRMQRGESNHRGIYGEASPDEADALAEEGIEVSRIPWLPRSDS